MTDRKPLLIELGTEELPPKALDELGAAFRDGVAAGLAKRGIEHTTDLVRGYWSPRRLAVVVGGVAERQPDQSVERRGPAVAAGVDKDGNPGKALTGFAASCGVGVEQLEKLETDKGAWFVHRSVKPGVATASLVPEIVAEALKALPVPKPMRWGSRDYAFVRPAHWLVMMLGDTVVEGGVLGLKADRMSRGHRFHHPKAVWIPSATDYVETLRGANVLVDPDERRARIRAEVEAAAAKVGGTARIPDALLAEVANIVEWPAAIACTFERDFLRVPQEALITTMESNQKFFPVLDAQGRLTEHFVGVANVVSKDPAEIRKGYERVIRPRFADAKFFFDDDLKAPLAQHQQALGSVTYQQKLGSVWDKCVRVAELARAIANRVGVDAALATRAAALSKCDLMTRMVGEFPELQGVMGRYYATAQGEPPAVAQALDEFYRPRFAGDAIAAGDVARVLAVAEKADTLAGLFAVGSKPTGNKDPFSLRRTALGLARTLLEAKLDLDLHALLREAATPVAADKAVAVADELHDFVLERLRGYYAEQGVRSDVFDAVAIVKPATLVDFDARLKAIVAFAQSPDAASLAAANKRIGNILKQAHGKGDAPSASVDPALLGAGEEMDLAQAISARRADVDRAVAARDFVGAMTTLAGLRPAVDAFFDKVMVMAEDPAVRRNRLALLNDLRQRFVGIADISVLQ